MGEMAVFAETNLGTRIVVLVSPHTSPNHLKREIERAHLNCFPQVGHIRVDALMVQRNSRLYHLPQTLPLKHVLKGFRPLLHAQVRQRKLKKIKRFACLKGALLRTVKRRKRNKYNGRKFKCLEGPAEPLVVPMTYGCEGKEESSDSSEAVSVSGIIRKYFSSHDEVNSHPFPDKTPSDQRASITKSKSKGVGIGSRIVSASKSLSSKRRLFTPAPIIPTLVFEMSDED